MTRSEVELNKGRDFYDDGYDSDEQSIGNRLDFANIKFFGRAKELSRLNEIWSQAGKKHPKSIAPFPLIAGYSGTGKSTLVRKLLEDLQRESELVNPSSQKRIFFLRGKYDELQRADPFSGIVAACSEFALMLQQGDPAHLKRVKDELNGAIGKEASQVLTSVVPGLKAILYQHENPGLKRAGSAPSSSDPNRWNRLMYAFQAFFKAISTKQTQVIIFLDDLQWSDDASLDLMTSLLTDTSLHHFMMIGAIRPNEVGPDHPLNKRLVKIAVTRPVERIEVQNLLKEDLEAFLCDLLNLAPEDTDSLTELLYDKTRGNMFFVKEMLEDLQRKSVLFFDMIEFRWTWDLDNVDTMAALSDNVIDVVAGKIKSLPKELQLALTVAAYTRSTFDTVALEKLIQAAGHCVNPEELVTLLDMAVHEGILSNSVGSERYTFAHDRIAKAAYSLVESEEERTKLRRTIGKCLFELATSGGGEDWMLYIAADHLNATTPVGEDLMFLVKLNLQIAERAFAVAAFAPASSYMKDCLDYLGQFPDHWNEHYDLSLRLFRLMADVEVILGNYEVGHRLGLTVLTHAKTDKDKLPTYLSLALALSRQERHNEARALHWDALKLMGETRPRLLLAPLLIQLRKVKVYLEINSNEEILKLPIMTDETVRMKIEFYADLGVRAYYCGKVEEFILVTLRMLRLSFKYGLCGAVGAAFTKYGLALASMGDQKGALRMARLARQILDRTGEKDTEAQALFIIGNMLEPWSFPFSHTMDTLQSARKSGMNHGDFEFAFLASAHIIEYAFVDSYHLDAIDAAFADLESQLRLYNMQNNTSLVTEDRLPVRYLSGGLGLQFDLKLMEGDFGRITNESEGIRLHNGLVGRLMLGVIFGDYDFAVAMFHRLEVAGFYKQEEPAVTKLRRVYFCGLLGSALARRTRQWKYFSIARRFVKEMQKFTSVKGNCLTVHKQLLMEAELFSLGRHKMAKVQSGYATAIEAALKMGNIDDAALGNELAGEFFLLKGKEDLAKCHLTEARNLYQQWGALAKVHQLKMKRSKYLDTSKPVPIKWSKGNAIDFQGRLGRSVGPREKTTTSSYSALDAGSAGEISETFPMT